MVLNHPMLFPVRPSVPYIHSNADNLIHFLVIVLPAVVRCPNGEEQEEKTTLLLVGPTSSCVCGGGWCLSEWAVENIAAQVTLLWSVKPTTFDWILPNDKNNLTLATRGERAREFSSMDPSQSPLAGATLIALKSG